MTEKIEIRQFDMANEKVLEPICLYLELNDDYLLYVAEYYAEVPRAEDKEDHSMGWVEQYHSFKIKIKRKVIVSLEIRWLPNREMWGVDVEAEGYPNTLSFYFKTEKEAEEMYKRLDNYIFG